jgi:hypothetical protein
LHHNTNAIPAAYIFCTLLRTVLSFSSTGSRWPAPSLNYYDDHLLSQKSRVCANWQPANVLQGLCNKVMTAEGARPIFLAGPNKMYCVRTQMAKPNNRNDPSFVDAVFGGAVWPRSGETVDLGSSSRRFGAIYANLEGSISDPDVEVNNIRWPYVGPNDLRLHRSGPKNLFLNDNSGGNATFQVQGALVSTALQTNSIATGAITSGTSANLDLPNGLITLTPGATQAVFNARLFADTQPRIRLHTADGVQWGSGTAIDVRLRRTAAGTLTLDNGSSAAGTIDLTGGTLTNVATVSRANALTVSTTGSNGALTLSANGSGNVILTSTTGNIQINRPITTSAGDLTLNPAGTNVILSNKALTSVGSINIPTSTSSDVILFSAAAVNTGAASGPRINLGGSTTFGGDASINDRAYGT